MSTQSESAIAQVNRNHFLREFTYSNQRFKTGEGQEREFADSAIWIDDLLILQEIKERQSEKVSQNPEEQAKWYESKVRGKAVDQLKRTMDGLGGRNPILLTNERGHVVDIGKCTATTIHKLVVFSPSPFLSPVLVKRKAYISERIGFVHFFTLYDYQKMCANLVTPLEIAEYLTWRQNICLHLPEECNAVTEKALVGQFLVGNDESGPSEDFEEYVDHLDQEVRHVNIFGLLSGFSDSIKSGEWGKKYYFILKELAKLKRNMIKEFDDRLVWAIRNCRKNTFKRPTRMSIPEYDCSYVIVPIVKEVATWSKYLETCTSLTKYDLKTRKAIGISIAPQTAFSKELHVDYCYMEGEWQYDQNEEDLLCNGDLFRPTRGKEVGKYGFK